MFVTDNPCAGFRKRADFLGDLGEFVTRDLDDLFALLLTLLLLALLRGFCLGDSSGPFICEHVVIVRRR